MLSALRKYNVALSAGTAGSDLVRLSIRKSGSDTFATGSDWSPAAGDVKVSKDGGAQSNIATLPSFSNGRWEFTLSATELSAKSISVIIANASIINDDILIETFGNASAMYSNNDYTDGVRMGMSALPNAAAGTNGGLPLSVDASGRVDVLKINGTSQTARDIGASVLLSSGTGTGQILLGSGQVVASSVQGNVTGNVGGNVAGGVLGGGVFVLSGIGVRAILDSSDTTATTVATNLDAKVSATATATTAAAIKAKTDLIATNSADSPNAITAQNTISTNLNATISSRLAASSYTAPDNADIATALSDLVTLLARTDPTTALAAIKTVTDELNGMIVAGAFTSASLANAPTGGGGGGGGLSGPSSVTLTFHDANGNPVPNVEFTLVGIGPGRANASGVATFGAQNGTYTVAAAITGGMLFSNTTLVVNGTTSLTISGTAITFVIGPPSTTTVYLTTRTISGAAQSGIVVQFQLTTPPAGATGDAFNGAITQVTSDVNGLVQIALPIGWGFVYWTITGQQDSATVPATGPYALPDLLGSYS